MIRVALSSSALIGSTIETVLETAAGAGAQGVEWVDEGFIRPGDNTAATSAMFATLKSSLCTVSYAAAIRVGQDTHEACTMALSTAGSLNAPILRLLPADRGLSSYAAERAFIKEARMLGEEAGNKGITLCFGLSPASVLDSYHSAAGLIAEVGHPFVKIAWAPDRDAGFDCSMETLSSISGMVALVVVRSEDLGLPAGAPVAAERDG
ncbi:MAG: hypothetical protein JXM71_09705, partial [Spirochaetales bacterium]|nr:hypothetical protein [Spirochaetales bacterium]